MNGDKNQRIRKTISRREFAVKSIVAAIALGGAGIAGYTILNSEKTKIFLNYHRMGHCAPSVIKTLLDVNGMKDHELIRSAGGMAGGIGGPKMECGALTAPIMFIGYQNGLPADMNEKLLTIRQAQTYFNEFGHNNGSTVCINIRTRGENGCWKAISGFYNSFMNSLMNPVTLPAGTEEAYSLLLNSLNNIEFHCSHSMLDLLKRDISLNNELYAASWPFVGGIAMLNRTCGALAAGVMALSSFQAQIETSYRRVARMNKLFREDNNLAMDNDVNEFNRAINSGAELGNWFRKEFGATSCYDICGYNFALKKDAGSFLSGNCIKKCRLITEKVAEKVKDIAGPA